MVENVLYVGPQMSYISTTTYHFLRVELVLRQIM